MWWKNLGDLLQFAPVKLLLSVQPLQQPEMQRIIAQKLPDGLTVVQTAPFYLEIIPVSINKGQGLQDTGHCGSQAGLCASRNHRRKHINRGCKKVQS